MALVASQEARASASTSDPSRSTALAVHRLRFVDWSPSAVTALVVSPSSAASTRGILAIGRQNGNIELCTWLGPRPALQSEYSDRSFQSDAAGWVVHTVLPGQAHSKIEQLCFVNPPDQHDSKLRKLRLFSVSGGSIVTEHFIPLQLAKLGARLSTQEEEDEAAVKVGDLSSLFGKKSQSNLDPHYPGETRTLPSLGGAIWSMAASATGQYLAIGCEDGQVRIVDLQDNKFEHLASSAGKQRLIVPRFDKTKGRIISLCWGPPIRQSLRTDAAADSDSDDDEQDATTQWYESFLVGGLGTSTAVVWEASTGRIASKLALQKNRSESTIVWSVATLPDGTIVTGDSTGRVTFFDPQTRTPISGGTFRAHANASDVLALTVGPDGRTVYSAGVDQKVAEFAKMDTSNQRGQWIQLASRRLHAHDVRAIALDPPYSPLSAVQTGANRHHPVDRLPILISGGVDFNLILTPAASPASITMALPATAIASLPKPHTKHRRELLTTEEQKHAAINPISSNPLTTFADTTQRRVPYVPTSARSGLMGGGSVVALCPSKSWIVLRREQSIGIWDLGSKEALVAAASANQSEEMAAAPAWYKLLEMQVKVDSNLVSVTISDDGKHLAFSDLYESRLFELRQRTLASGLREIEPKKVKTFGKCFGGQERMAPSASALRFSPDSTRLVLSSLTGAYVHVVELPSDRDGGSSCRLLRSFGHHRKQRPASESADARQIAGRNGHDTKQDRVERTVSTVIQHVEISSDGAWLSTISSDLQHHIFSLDSLTFERTLPSPHVLPSGAVFHPSTSSQCSSLLTLVFSDNKVEFWDVESGKELAKSNTDRDAPESTTTPRKTGANGAGSAQTLLIESLTKLKHTLQTKLASVREFAISAMWISGDRADAGAADLITNYTMLIYGATWICTARVAKSAPSLLDEDMPDANAVAKKRTRQIEWTVHTTFKYQPLLLVAHLPTQTTRQQQQQHVVIIERPYFELASTLPPAFYRGARYGS